MQATHFYYTNLHPRDYQPMHSVLRQGLPHNRSIQLLYYPLSSWNDTPDLSKSHPHGNIFLITNLKGNLLFKSWYRNFLGVLKILDELGAIICKRHCYQRYKTERNRNNGRVVKRYGGSHIHQMIYIVERFLG